MPRYNILVLYRDVPNMCYGISKLTKHTESFQTLRRFLCRYENKESKIISLTDVVYDIFVSDVFLNKMRDPLGYHTRRLSDLSKEIGVKLIEEHVNLEISSNIDIKSVMEGVSRCGDPWTVSEEDFLAFGEVNLMYIRKLMLSSLKTLNDMCVSQSTDNRDPILGIYED